METSKADVAKAVLSYLANANAEDIVQKMHLYGIGAVNELEMKLKEHYSMKHALCVSNATTGLMAIALALRLHKEEFITTPYTYGATVSGWLLMGNKPVFADVETNTLTLNYRSIRKRITAKTRAILVSDIYGNPHDTVGLRRIADEYGLWYISDSAQSLGAYRDEMPAGALADALVVSFTVGKTVFAGEGAAIVTNNSELYQKLVWLTQHPLRQKRELGLHLSNEFGLNARIHPLGAIWANAVFDNSMNELKHRQQKIIRLIKVLNEIGLAEEMIYSDHGIKPSFYKISAAWKNGKRAESALLQELMKYGYSIKLDISPFQLLYRQPAFIAQYAKYMSKSYSCPNAESQSGRRFCLDIPKIRRQRHHKIQSLTSTK